MTLDLQNFTPLQSLAGGALIGLSAALLALLVGRIAGISGIVGGLLRPKPNEVLWRVAFVAGLLTAPAFYMYFAGLPAVQIDASWSAIILAGLLVGWGTRYASGCTSGHGVCGLARGSVRSLAAVVTFMLAGFLTVAVLRHVWGF